MDLEFEKYFQRKLQEDQDTLKSLPFSSEQLQEIYRTSYEYEKRAPILELQMKSQPISYDALRYYLPEKWELTRAGKLLTSEEEIQRVLRLLIFSLGIEKSLDVIPRQLIEQYLNNSNER